MSSTVTKSTEYLNTLQLLMERALQCRPNDPLSFALRYFEDESEFGSAETDRCRICHVFQLLPYLLTSHAEFKDSINSLFCHVLGQSPRKNSELIVSARELHNLLQEYRLHERWDIEESIEQVVNDITASKAIDFFVFTSAFRVYTLLYVMINWMKSFVKSIIRQQSNEVSSTIDIKTSLQFMKRFNSTYYARYVF